MPDLKKFKINFLHRGHIKFVYVIASGLHEADVWKHLADHLGIFYCNSEGRTMLSHSIKKVVEANGVTEITVEELEVAGATTQANGERSPLIES